MRIPTRTRARMAAGSAVLVAAVPLGAGLALAGGTGPVPATCDAEVAVAFEGAGFGAYGTGTIVSGLSSLPTSRTVGADVPAGTWDVSTVSYDGGKGRAGHEPWQLREQYVLELLDADGVVIATTGATPDLTDGVEETTWTGPVGRVELDRPATAVRARHAAIGDPDTPNSVMPVCAGFDAVAPPSTTSTTTTTTSVAPPSTSEEPVPLPTLGPAPSTEAPGPTTTTTSTTTTVPARVLGSTQRSPVAQPVTAQPAFTG